MKNSTVQPNGNEFDRSDCPFSAGETVPYSGLYEMCHPDEPRTKVILTFNEVFPLCGTCDERVRYKLLQAARHISEDSDFNEFLDATYNPVSNGTAPKQVLSQQLGLAHGFRFRQDNIQAWRDFSEAGDL